MIRLSGPDAVIGVRLLLQSPGPDFVLMSKRSHKAEQGAKKPSDKAPESRERTIQPALELAVRHQSAGRLPQAEAICRQILETDPNQPSATHLLGVIARQQGKNDIAVYFFTKALAIEPDYAQAHNHLGNALKDLGRLGDAVASYQKAISSDPDYAEAHYNLGVVFKHRGGLDDAVASYHKAVIVNPDYAKAHHNLGFLYEKMNRLERADVHIRKALDIDPDFYTAHISLAVLLRRRGEVNEAIESLERLLSRNLSGIDSYRIHFELGKCYDLEKDYDQAFKHFAKGNEIQAQNLPVNVIAERGLNNVVRAGHLLTPEFFSSWVDASHCTAIESPVFLVGFPRSGTTLLDQILDGHPRLQIMEEKPALSDVRSAIATMSGGYPSAIASLRDIDILTLRGQYFRSVERYIHRRPGTILVDKLPLNICHIPLIVRLFPNSPIILALRHPCDVVLSNFMQYYRLNDAMANFLSIDGAARFYNRVMGFWLQCVEMLPLRFHSIRYEDLVADFDSELRNLLQFLDVDWDDAMLDYRTHAQHRGEINTTPSYEQVTEPIYQRAKFRWTRYEKHVKSVREDLKPFIEAFGYSGS